MTTTLALPAPSGHRSTLLNLAGFETRRLIRHPVFLAGFAVIAFATVDGVIRQPSDDISVAVDGVALSAGSLLGLTGFIAANRLARSTERCDDVVGAAPVDEPTRTWALCLACLAPALIALVAIVVAAGVWVNDRGSITWAAFSTRELLAYHLAVVLAALGGPLLGVTVGRWWRWPTAGAVGAVGLVTWSVLSGAFTTNVWLTLNHMAAPFFVLITGTGDNSFRQGGSLEWHVPYIMGLCALAAITAALHGAGGRQRTRLLRCLVVVGVITVASLILSTVTGPDGYPL